MVQKRQHDRTRGDDGGERVAVAVKDHEGINYKVEARVDKFDKDQLHRCATALGLKYREPTGEELLAWAEAIGEEYESVSVPGNLLTTAGLSRATGLILVLGGQGYDATHTRIGVGDTSTAANVADTDLGASAGSTHRQFIVADSAPSRSDGVITIVATFGTSVANFAWAEWCVDNGGSNGTTVTSVMLNHKITSLGTKTSSASWVFTITITFS